MKVETKAARFYQELIDGFHGELTVNKRDVEPFDWRAVCDNVAGGNFGG